MNGIIATSLVALTLAGCQSTQPFHPSPPVTSWDGLATRVLSGDIPAKEFAGTGPFATKAYWDYQIALSPEEPVLSDVMLSRHNSHAPLVIFMHGNGFTKASHELQAQRLASWGFHAMTVQLPKRRQWARNGATLDRLARLISRYPKVVAPNVHPKRVILVGHSFGGAAVTVAAARGAPVRGLVLLDPALFHPRLVKQLAQVRQPSILLGADPKVFRSKRRKLFFRWLRGPIAEISISRATHNDAQYPSHNQVMWGFDWATSQTRQELFLRHLVAACFSLAATGNVDYAWRVYRQDPEALGIKDSRVRFVERPPGPAGGIGAQL